MNGSWGSEARGTRPGERKRSKPCRRRGRNPATGWSRSGGAVSSREAARRWRGVAAAGAAGRSGEAQARAAPLARVAYPGKRPGKLADLRWANRWPLPIRRRSPGVLIKLGFISLYRPARPAVGTGRRVVAFSTPRPSPGLSAGLRGRRTTDAELPRPTFPLRCGEGGPADLGPGDPEPRAVPPAVDDAGEIHADAVDELIYGRLDNMLFAGRRGPAPMTTSAISTVWRSRRPDDEIPQRRLPLPHSSGAATSYTWPGRDPGGPEQSQTPGVPTLTRPSVRARRRLVLRSVDDQASCRQNGPRRAHRHQTGPRLLGDSGRLGSRRAVAELQHSRAHRERSSSG